MSYTPIESFEYPGWYIIPDCPGYLANKDGMLFILKTGRKTYGGFSEDDYCRIRVTVENIHKYTLVHRLVCAAFHGAASSEKYFVNHKNGIKNDNRSINLEWVSQKENNIHAVETGLSFKRGWRGLKVYDVLEKHEMCFRSKFDFVKFVKGSSLSGVFNAILNKRFYLNRYFIIDIHNEFDFSYIKALTNNWYKYRYLTDDDNIPDIVVTSITSMAKMLGLDNCEFNNYVKSGKVLFGYRLIKPYNDNTAWPTMDEITKLDDEDTPDVVVFSVSKKTYYIFRSAGAAASHFNVSRNTLLRRCLTKKHVLNDDLLVKFLKTDGPLTFSV